MGRLNSDNLKVRLGDLTLKNPVIPASGCFGFGHVMAQYYDLDMLGAISIKGTTLKPRFGNPLPRVAECTSGMINSVGLMNPGVEGVINEELPELRKVYHGPVIANISGFSIEEYCTCCDRMDGQEQVDIIELNVSCPNVHGGGMAFGTSEFSIASVTRTVKRHTMIPVYVKLSPNVTDIASMAKAAEDAGADGLVCANTFLGMRFDLKHRKPVVANIMGGFSGPAVFPMALRMVYQVSKAVNIPVIGCGGVMSADDVLEMMLAGAKAVEVGTANLIDPMACHDIIRNLPAAMQKYGFSALDEIEPWRES